MAQAPAGRQVPVMKTFLGYYAGTGLTFQVAYAREDLYESTPFPVVKAPGTMGFVRNEGHLYLLISDKLPSDYDFLYLKDAGATDALLRRQITAAALTGTLVALFMAGALYVLLYRVNLPVSRLAHEMRTPLTAMKGYAETLRDARLTEEQRYMAAGYIAEESTRLTDISARLLTLHNAREENTPYGPVDVEELFDHIQQTYPTVTYEVRWPTLLGDRTMLSSLLNNLVDNDNSVLIIKDSFGLPVYSFLSLGIHEVRAIDMRIFEKNVLEYAAEYHPDVVILMYNCDS